MRFRRFAFSISGARRIRSDYSIPKASLRSANAMTAQLAAQRDEPGSLAY
jgi:hypothetical protein